MIAARRLSPVELVQQCLDRIEASDHALHSFITVTPERALADARAAEQRMMRGSLRGRLDGIPIAHKDVIATQGIRTTAHSRLLETWVPDEDAHVASLLRQAGTALLGKLATHEFAWGGPPFDLPWPPARNPWDIARFTSGSSSGTAVAVAAGFVLGGTGTDTAGSIRAPAALCGLAGIKPTSGLCSKRGVIPLSATLDHVGPMAWTAQDCALLLQEMAGHDGIGSDGVRRTVPDFSATLEDGVKGVRIGVAARWHETDHEAGASVQAGIRRALDIWTGLGARVVCIQPPPLHAYQAANLVIMAHEGFANHAPRLRTRYGDYGELLRNRLSLGALLDESDYAKALKMRQALMHQTSEAMAQVDVLVTAGAAAEAPLMEDVMPWGDLARPGYYHPFNLTGWPAMCVRTGHGDAGLPLSIQIAARRYQEPLIFQVAHALERALDLKQFRPSMPRPE